MVHLQGEFMWARIDRYIPLKQAFLRLIGASVLRGFRKRRNRSNSIKSVLDFDGVENQQSSDSKVKLAKKEDISAERGACGVGFIANLDNKGSHGIVQDALTALGCMEHRGGCVADNDSGDGSGLTTSTSWEFFNKWAEK
ncbi:hypothetical protein L1987_27367 [Smallanthus sonchifolius]|uniref:Uncharacterized protein n=1 Tax=Smallanthus sonchifolius TaxID=185202 RepID=A0ACB9IBK1_9ASTR|nr:hypothetical protein L1987_27367 [Smallanthus sonchifolius]